MIKLIEILNEIKVIPGNHYNKIKIIWKEIRKKAHENGDFEKSNFFLKKINNMIGYKSSTMPFLDCLERLDNKGREDMYKILVKYKDEPLPLDEIKILGKITPEMIDDLETEINKNYTYKIHKFHNII